jgi:hypothetical protein
MDSFSFLIIKPAGQIGVTELGSLRMLEVLKNAFSMTSVSCFSYRLKGEK